ncbi:MAG: 5-formyltetrahydrofolate cyclo-ligase [Bdellovibrionales bacterium]
MTAAAALADRKLSLRRECRARLHGILRPDLKTNWDQKIAQFLEQLLPIAGGQAAAFVGLHDEPALAEPLLKMKSWSWGWPKVVGDNLHFYNAKQTADFVVGPYGLQEPDARMAKEVALQDCAVVCVPGLAFDRRGARLGRGKGYYDRALQHYGGTKVGVAYSVQIENQDLPFEPHDVRMDYVVTENFILKPKG